MQNRTMVVIAAAIVVTAAAGFAQNDVGKTLVEMPIKKSLRADATASKKATNTTGTTDPFVNPKVAPGLVRWHNSPAAATAAAKKSGKPVFVFQLLGRLDDAYC